MDLQGIADFIALAEHLSFSKAAHARHVTQPAFSRRIKALEADLSLVLVDRNTTPLTLTAAGLHFLHHAQSLAGLNQSVLADMKSLATNMPQALHIEMSNSLSTAFFPVWYRNMQRQVRGLTFRLSHQRTAQTLHDLRSGLADFALHLTVKGITRDYDYTGIRQQVIAHDRLLFMRAASAKHDETALIMHRVGSYMNPCLDKVLGPQRAKMKVVFESPSSEFSRSMTLAGFGAALLQENLIADDVKDGFLVPALPNLKPLTAQIVLLRPARTMSAKAEALWEKSALKES